MAPSNAIYRIIRNGHRLMFVQNALGLSGHIIYYIFGYVFVCVCVCERENERRTPGPEGPSGVPELGDVVKDRNVGGGEGSGVPYHTSN